MHQLSKKNKQTHKMSIKDLFGLFPDNKINKFNIKLKEWKRSCVFISN